MSVNYVTTGDPELDDLLGGGFRRGCFIAVFGEPGSGKTIFAAQIAFMNALLNGKRVLFISTMEDEARFLSFMKSIGFDFEEIKKMGLFRYVHLLMLEAKDVVILMSETFAKWAEEFKADIVIVDGMHRIFTDKMGFEGLPLGIYQITSVLNATLIMLGDVLEDELDWVGLYADVILRLQAEYEGEVVNRYLEIRKVRTAPLHVVRIPYTISWGEGLKFLVPKPFPPKELVRKSYFTGCTSADKAIGPILSGTQMLIINEPGTAISRHIYAYLASLILNNGLKVGFLNYSGLLSRAYHRMRDVITSYGGDPKALDERVVFEEGFNPTRVSLTAILDRETRVIVRTNPDIVIMEGYGILYRIFRDKRMLISLQYNSALDFRSKGIIGVRFMTSKFPEEDVPATEFSDLVVLDRLEISENKMYHVYHIIRPLKGEPFICRGEELDSCFNKVIPRLTGVRHAEVRGSE